MTQLTRRHFLAGLAALTATPLVAKLPHGFTRENGIAYLIDKEIVVDKTIVIDETMKCVIHGCKFIAGDGLEGPFFIIKEGCRLDMRDCDLIDNRMSFGDLCAGSLKNLLE